MKKAFVDIHKPWAGNGYLVILYLNHCVKKFMDYEYELFYHLKGKKEHL